MPHIDPADLALLALGEPPNADLEHLESCAECVGELARLQRVADLGRSASPELPVVPEAVWAGIAAELGIAEPGPSQSEGPADAESSPAAGTGTASITPLPTRRRRTAGLFAAAATVGALVGGTVVWAATGGGEPPAVAAPVVAQAVLTPISDSVTVSGKAEVLETPDGLMVRIDARGLPVRSGFHEVWLLDSEGQRLVALGALPSGSVGTFTVPPGIQIADFPVVDISIEPYDGDPGHSHDSLLRGVLA